MTKTAEEYPPPPVIFTPLHHPHVQPFSLCVDVKTVDQAEKDYHIDLFHKFIYFVHYVHLVIQCGQTVAATAHRVYMFRKGNRHQPQC